MIILVLSEVQMLDLAGPLQVFDSARELGLPYRTRLCATTPSVRSGQGLWLAKLAPLPEPAAGDLVIVPGVRFASLASLDPAVGPWLRAAVAGGAHICSICTGAFVLAQAGLLRSRQCTTHWLRIAALQEAEPAAHVLSNRLFVTDGPITSSAGIASGIDTALALVERGHGPLAAATVARELVVYMRRDGSQPQQSIYVDYRTHLHPGVHRVQDALVARPERPATIEELAALAGMSPRHLTRVFRQATGISIKAFATRLRLEVAQGLLHDPQLTVEEIAARCGFQSARQLRRLWRAAFGSSPAVGRARGSYVTGAQQ